MSCEILILHSSTVVLNIRIYEILFNMFCAYQNHELEEARKQVLLAGTLEVQKCFRAYQARRYYHELKRGVISLQSCKDKDNIPFDYYFASYTVLVIFLN